MYYNVKVFAKKRITKTKARELKQSRVKATTTLLTIFGQFIDCKGIFVYH